MIHRTVTSQRRVKRSMALPPSMVHGLWEVALKESRCRDPGPPTGPRLGKGRRLACFWMRRGRCSVSRGRRLFLCSFFWGYQKHWGRIAISTASEGVILRGYHLTGPNFNPSPVLARSGLKCPAPNGMTWSWHQSQRGGKTLGQ